MLFRGLKNKEFVVNSKNSKKLPGGTIGKKSSLGYTKERVIVQKILLEQSHTPLQPYSDLIVQLLNALSTSAFRFSAQPGLEGFM